MQDKIYALLTTSECLHLVLRVPPNLMLIPEGLTKVNSDDPFTAEGAEIRRLLPIAFLGLAAAGLFRRPLWIYIRRWQ